jgi:thioredoxin 1
MICIFGICFPISSLIPLCFLLLKPIATFLGLWPGIESLVKKSKNDDKVCFDTKMSNLPEFGGEYLNDGCLWPDVLKGESPILVRFSAKWCKPCKTAEPFYLSLVGSNKLKSISIDIDDFEEIASTEGVISLPTFKVYKNGVCVESISSSDSGALEKLVKKYSS